MQESEEIDMGTKRNIGEELVQGMQEAVDYMRGKKKRAITHKVEIPDTIDVKSIRKNLKLSRPAFADRFGFSSRTIQHWEQGDRRPQGAARVLLVLLQRAPKTVEEILNAPINPHSTTHRAMVSARAVSKLQSHRIIHKRKAR
jgi:putative transcriptional regulator